MKNIVYFVVGLFLISSFTAVGIRNKTIDQQDTVTLNLSFSDLKVANSNIETYKELSLEGAKGCLYRQGEPILPIYSTKLDFAFGTKIKGIECTTSETSSMVLSEKIIPAPTPVLQGIEDSQAEYKMDETVYNANQLYPNNWFEYYTGAGLDENNQHKTFLILQAYPVRYNPVTNTLNYVDSLKLTITYEEPKTNPFPTDTEYQLVIIAPQKFAGDLEKLKTFKESKGVTTLIKTTEDIYAEFNGTDKPEQIKYFIKYALENYNTEYVMLVGGLKSMIYANPRDDINQGTTGYYLPVRYTNNREPGVEYDPGFISDLYYADIYDSEGNFSSWDSNHDGVYARWSNVPGKDIIDLYPDVYVGRLAARNKLFLRVMINKIINYEKQPADPSWYNKMIVLGGDTDEDPGTDYYEGEVTCDFVLTKYMSSYTPVKIYASNTDPLMTPETKNIVREISKGAGHLLFDGHANPASWTTHYPNDFETWAGGIQVNDMIKLHNGAKLPVCIVGGCHNSQFNVSMIWCLSDADNSKHSWCYGYPIPDCWSEWMTRKIGGGTIATMGNTGLGYGAAGENGDIDGDGVNDPDCVEALGGYQEAMYYKAFTEGANHVGAAWGQSISLYLDTFPGMADQIDCKTVQQFPLLGDPSLMIGGYS